MKKTVSRRKKMAVVVMLCLVFCLIGLNQWRRSASDATSESKKIIIAIDAGHGGFDPGKVGVNQAVEKDINLSIAKKLKEALEAKGFETVMTRESDEALHKEGQTKATKQEDMKKRVSLINESGATAAVSIHQNSFTEESSHGAQVFYHPQSEEGKQMALVLQAKIKECIADDNHREAKSNESYYMLKKTECPLVIVECGFLSNAKEAELLITDEYQQKMAEAIAAGISQYLEESSSETVSWW